MIAEKWSQKVSERKRMKFTLLQAGVNRTTGLLRAEMYGRHGSHIITSRIEHPAVLNTCRYLEDKGFDVTYLTVDENGLIKLSELKKAIRHDTFLISVMYANNEVGTIEPIREIGEIAHKSNIIFHTDAVQAYGHIPINVNDCNIDLLSASGHKMVRKVLVSYM